MELGEVKTLSAPDLLRGVSANVFAIDFPARNEEHKGAIQKAVLGIRAGAIVDVFKYVGNLEDLSFFSAVEFTEGLTRQRSPPADHRIFTRAKRPTLPKWSALMYRVPLPRTRIKSLRPFELRGTDRSAWFVFGPWGLGHIGREGLSRRSARTAFTSCSDLSVLTPCTSSLSALNAPARGEMAVQSI